MSELGVSVIATVALGFGPIMFARSFRDFKTRRLIENTPTARIRSMAMGLVEVNGKVLPHSTVTAPFSGRSCAYWEVDIATRSGQRRNSWSIVHRNASGQPFFLRDETGVALVYPHGAQCKVHVGTEEICLGIMVPDCYASYMSDQGLTARHLWRLSSMRFRERILEDGQMLYVLGTAMPRSRSVDISDGELEATGTDGHAGGRLRELHDQTAAVIRRGENQTTFILSQGSERQLVTDLGLRAAGELIAGPVLALFGLGYWLFVLSSGIIFH